jgi:hypothetical protein
VPHMLWHEASVFPVSSEGPPHLIDSYDSQGDTEDLFLPGSSRVCRTTRINECLRWIYWKLFNKKQTKH